MTALSVDKLRRDNAELLEALRNISETAHDTSVAWEARLYQIKRYADSAIAKVRKRNE